VPEGLCARELGAVQKGKNEKQSSRFRLQFCIACKDRVDSKPQRENNANQRDDISEGEHAKFLCSCDWPYVTWIGLVAASIVWFGGILCCHDGGPSMSRVFAIASVFGLLVLAALLHSGVKDFLWAHPWWHSFLIALPALILAVLELFHSGEANTLRTEANNERIRANSLHAETNVLSEKANQLRNENAALTATIDRERNEHLSNIAAQMKKPPTKAQRNGDILRQHLRKYVAVSQGAGGWPSPPEIAEVSDDNIVSLFTPKSNMSSQAFMIQVDCDDLEITEFPKGACPIQMKVLKQYGTTVQLGEITRWEDRQLPNANPVFAKGSNVAFALYEKQGTSIQRIVSIHIQADASNSFLLQTSEGDRMEGDNISISKRFMALQIDYLSEGFTRRNFSPGSNPIPLYIS
jgi:hypothetical protein